MNITWRYVSFVIRNSSLVIGSLATLRRSVSPNFPLDLRLRTTIGIGKIKPLNFNADQILMPVNAQRYQSHPSDEVKNLFLESELSDAPDVEYLPHFYAEVRIDFNDVRTGFRETVSLTNALEIYSEDADLLWAADMIRDVNPQKTKSVMPESAHLVRLPEYVNANFMSRMENKFTEYLLRCFEERIYKNFALNIYSFSGESLAEFTRRCMELFDGQMRQELNCMNEVFKRKLERIKERYLSSEETGAFERAREESQKRNDFSLYSDRIANLFVQGELRKKPNFGRPRTVKGMQELDERLMALESEAQRAIVKIRETYEEKARAVDEYILHPNIRDIHFVRSCILWIPSKAIGADG
jgi:hypothetical protein